MTLAIDLSAEEIRKAGITFQKDMNKLALQSYKKALSRSAPTLKRISYAAIRREYALTPGKVWGQKKRMVDEAGNSELRVVRTALARVYQKTKVPTITQAQLVYRARSRGISLVRFLNGKPETLAKQRGAVSKRKKVRVTIKPGNRKTMAKAFVAKVKGNYHVFSRDEASDRRKKITTARGQKTNSQLPIKKQSVPSLAYRSNQPRWNRYVVRNVSKKIIVELQKALPFYIQKYKDKI